MNNVPPSVRAALKRRGADAILNQEGDYINFKSEIDKIIHGDETSDRLIQEDYDEEYENDLSPVEKKATERIEELGDKYKTIGDDNSKDLYEELYDNEYIYANLNKDQASQVMQERTGKSKEEVDAFMDKNFSEHFWDEELNDNVPSEKEIDNLRKQEEMKKSFKDTPEWKAMKADYDANQNGYNNSYDAIHNWTDRSPWEWDAETLQHYANYKDNPNNYNNDKSLARAAFLNKHRDILSKQIAYDTQRNKDYREFLESPEFKKYRLEQLLSESDLDKDTIQGNLRKMFNSKYGYDENENAYFHDFDYGEIDQGKRNGFRSTLDLNKPEDEEKYFRFLDNTPVDKKKTLKRLIGNGDIDIDELIQAIRGK